MSRNASKRFMAFILVLSILLGSGPGYIASGQSLYSKASSWAQPEIKNAADNGLLPPLLTGSDMTKPATREELCELSVFLYEKLNGKALTPASPNPFKDTKNPNILKAYEIGITTGTSATTFSPYQSITREQVATMYGRAVKTLYPSIDYSVPTQTVFNDQSLIASYALPHVLFMNREGIIKGAEGSFMPRPITERDKTTGYGMTTREQAIAISVRIFQRFSDTPVQPTTGLSNKEKTALSFIAKPSVQLTEKAKFDQIDFAKRVFRPIYQPKLTLMAGEALTSSGSRNYTSAPFAAFIDSDGSKIHPFKISLPADIVNQASKIVWEVSKIPFDGAPTGFFARKQPGVVLSGSISKTATYFEVDFGKINQGIWQIKPIKQLGSNVQLASTNISQFNLPNFNFPELNIPDSGWKFGDLIITGKDQDVGPVTYYVRAYPANSLGASIGDAGSGLPVLFGKPIPAKSKLALTSIVDNFQMKPAKFAGDVTYGKEFANNFIDLKEVGFASDSSKRYSFLPSGYPSGTQKLLLQVTLSKPVVGSDAWREPAGLLYEKAYLPSDPDFIALKDPQSYGLEVDFTSMVPTDEQLGNEKVTYYVRTVALSEGTQPGTVSAKFSNYISVFYGKAQAPKFFKEIKIQPRIPVVQSMHYEPIKWEYYDWAYHYLVFEQPTYEDVFGPMAGMMGFDGDDLYTDYKVGTKLDFTPQPAQDKSWWEEAWDAITEFVSNIVDLVKSVVNWVSATFDKIKSGLINAVLSTLDLPEPFNSALKTALTALVDYGLASIGIPPTLPNFDDLANMGVDYLATVAMQQAGIPAEDFIKEGVIDLADGLSDELSKSTAKSATPNPMDWNFIKFDPYYLYKPGYITITIKNPYNTPTPKGRLTFRAEHIMDLSQNGKNEAITQIYGAYGTSYVQVYKPICGLEIPQLAPGQEITIPLILEEYVGIPFYSGGPAVDRNYLRRMYWELGKYDFNIMIDYDLPPIQEAMKEQNYTEEAIYSYSTTGNYITFSTEPYVAK